MGPERAAARGSWFRTRGSGQTSPIGVEEILQRLRLDHLARANPYTLSGGEQRRLSVATVLATAPDVLVLGPGLADGAPRAAAGHARWAGWGWALVAASGGLAAWQQLGGSSGIGTPYGALLAVKLVVLLVLGALAARHRRRVLRAVSTGDRAALARGAVVELALAAVAIGLSGVLAAADPPSALATVAGR